MSKPSVMRQDHGVAILFNASITSAGRNIFCYFVREKVYRFDEIDIKIIGDVWRHFLKIFEFEEKLGSMPKLSTKFCLEIEVGAKHR